MIPTGGFNLVLFSVRGMLMPVGDKGKLAANIIWDLGFNALNKRSSSASGVDGNILERLHDPKRRLYTSF